MDIASDRLRERTFSTCGRDCLHIGLSVPFGLPARSVTDVSKPTFVLHRLLHEFTASIVGNIRSTIFEHLPTGRPWFGVANASRYLQRHRRTQDDRRLLHQRSDSRRSASCRSVGSLLASQSRLATGTQQMESISSIREPDTQSGAHNWGDGCTLGTLAYAWIAVQFQPENPQQICWCNSIYPEGMQSARCTNIACESRFTSTSRSGQVLPNRRAALPDVALCRSAPMAQGRWHHYGRLVALAGRDVLDLWFSIAGPVRRESQSSSSTAAMVGHNAGSINAESRWSRTARTRLAVLHSEQNAAASANAAIPTDNTRCRRGAETICTHGGVRFDRQSAALCARLLRGMVSVARTGGRRRSQGATICSLFASQIGATYLDHHFPGLADAVIGWSNNSGKSKMSREVYASTEPTLVTHLPTYRYPDCFADFV